MTVYELAGTVYREVTMVAAGEAGDVDVPFPVQLWPAELAGKRQRG